MNQNDQTYFVLFSAGIMVAFALPIILHAILEIIELLKSRMGK